MVDGPVDPPHVHFGGKSPPCQAGFWGWSVWLEKVRQKVYLLVKEHPELANDDRELVLAIWRTEGLDEVLVKGAEAFYDWFHNQATPADTITRSGRKLRECGLVQASSKSRVGREKTLEAWRAWALGNKEDAGP
jgi:hypothetical protein